MLQIRVSHDNVPGVWYNQIVGESELLAYAVGIAPFKDTFWTTAVQAGSPYGPNRTEPSPALNAAIATLSCGPVLPGDAMGLTNLTLLSRSYRADGLILRPDRPAFSLDASYYHRALPSSAQPDALQITHTYVQHSVSDTWHILLVLSESAPYGLTLSDLGASTLSQYLCYRWQHGSVHLDDLRVLTASSPLQLIPNPTQFDSFELWQMAPIWSFNITTAKERRHHSNRGSSAAQEWRELALLGDISKWVPASKQRMQNVAVQYLQHGMQNGQRAPVFGVVSIDLLGSSGEAVEVHWSSATRTADLAVAEWQLDSITCVIGGSGTGLLRLQLGGSGWLASCSSE